MDDSVTPGADSTPPPPPPPLVHPTLPAAPSAPPRAGASAVSYTELATGSATSSADALRTRQRRRRWVNNVSAVIALALLAGLGVILYQAYETHEATRTTDDDFAALCRSDRRSIAVSLRAYQGDRGRPPDSIEDLRVWGLPDDAAENWTLEPSETRPGEVVLRPTLSGRCA